MAKKKVWRKSYGDGECTDDSVLWINGKPTKNIVSPCSGCFFAYCDNKEIGVYDSRKNAKEEIECRLLYKEVNGVDYPY